VKFVIKYDVRTAGLTWEESLANDETLLTAFSKWEPPDGFTIHQFVTNVANNSGYMVVESTDSAVILSAVSPFRFWADYEVIPVVDVDVVVQVDKETSAWARDALTA
jgi:hypothetical protein